jgi:hypothetical protein
MHLIVIRHKANDFQKIRWSKDGVARPPRQDLFIERSQLL